MRDNFKIRVLIGAIFLILPLLFFNFYDSNIFNFKNRYEKNLAYNGIYQLFSSFRQNILDYEEFYQTLPNDEVLTHLKTLLKSSNSTYLKPNDKNSILREIKNQGREIKPNVMLIMVESLSSQFLGVLGDKRELTPNLDILAKNSLFFRHIYATGTRTVRGMEAVTLSVPPTAGRSIIKRVDNHNIFSIGEVFKNKGYQNSFIYGGYGYFDNMNDFFSHNGFNIVDRANFKKDEITFANIWGVCDEDIFNKAIKVANSSKKPFFNYIMTISNHRPYTYPDNKIDIPSHTGRKGAVKYTDFAIGEFIKKAKKESWFDNTIFIIVADHQASSAGKSLIPIHKYQIPLIFYAPKLLKPKVVDKIASQIDVMPTLFNLLNWNYKSKFYGKNILDNDFKQRAFVGTYQKLGFFRDNILTILNTKKEIKSYQLLKESLYDSKLKEIKVSKKDKLDTITFYQSASYRYKNRFGRSENKIR